jgi:tRNA nucleotidyltransferase (CCA-adding enzyme)
MRRPPNSPRVCCRRPTPRPRQPINLFTTYAAEAVLWLGFTSKQAAVREKYDNFLKVWPQARQRIPLRADAGDAHHAGAARLSGLVKSIFLQLIDGGLTTNDEIRALLEPHSPPAPPPPVTIKRTRAKKGADAKAKARLDDEERSPKMTDEEVEDDEEEDDLDGLDLGTDDLDLTLGLDDVAPTCR